ncbi:MAG: hypothetical protein ACI36V_06785 [Coriobacteriales bacterium]
MRKLNAALGATLYVVIIIHVLLGCYMLFTGAYVPVLKLFARIAAVLIIVHLLLGIVFFARSCKGGGVFKHPGLNKRFWVQRISALGIIAIMMWHGHSFGGMTPEGYALFSWDAGKLALTLLFAACLGAHLTTSVPALAISLGIPLGKGAQRGLQAVIVAIVLLSALTFCVYAKGMWA